MSALSVGRSFFGVAAAASGIQQLITGEFVRLVPKGPSGSHEPSAWPYLVGVVLVAAGFAMLSGRMTRLAGSIVVGMILVSLALVQVPRVVANPWVGFMWTNPLKALALVGGGAILAGTLPQNERSILPSIQGVGRFEFLGAVLLAVFLAVCGVQHFVYSDFVAGLVPSWIPGPKFWTYFTGVALIAGGVGILVPPTARLAATLSALMIFLWVLLLHIPRALAGPDNASETAGIFEALAVSGVALMVAATRAPWRSNGGGGTGQPS